MISATSSPCQPFPLLDCTMCSSGTSNTVSRLLSSKGVCSTPCLPSCCQTDAADTGVVLHQRSANAFLRFYHRTSSSQKNCPRDTNRRSSPATPSVVHQMLSAAFLGLSVVNFVGGPNRPLSLQAHLLLQATEQIAPNPAMSHYPGEILLIILWMSYFLYPQLARLPAAAKTVSQQKKGQNFSRVISKFTSRDSVIITPC